MTMRLIQHQELSSAQSSITFSSIPQTYTDLLLVFSARTDNTNVTYSNTEILFNGSSSNFSARRMFGDASTVGSYTATNISGLVSSAGSTSNTFGSTRIYIPNYTASVNKSYTIDSISEHYNSTGTYQEIIAGLWSQTAPITSITIKGESTRNLLQYSSASLYGIIKFTPSAAKATGGTVTYDPITSSWVHTFTASGTFTPSQDLTDVEYLVIAGGGGGGNSTGVQYASGGGAGGYRSSVTGEMSGGGASAESKLSLTKYTGYTVTVGAGGAPTVQGSDSTFAGITSLGGARGRGDAANATGYSGGSGSGGTRVSGAGGAGTAGQGYAGGWGSSSGSSSDSAGGGGGGAGSMGDATASNWFTNAPLAGGQGVQSKITGTLLWYAAGGTGSGYYSGTRTNGIGGSTPSDMDGIVNTGSGGGGGRNGTGGSGASGVVIVRYKA